MVKIVYEPGTGQKYISTYDLLRAIDGVSDLVFKTPGGNVPKVLKIERDGNRAVVTFTN